MHCNFGLNPKNTTLRVEKLRSSQNYSFHGMKYRILTHPQSGLTSIAFGEGGVEEVVAAVDEIVECRGAEYEVALQHEIPQHRHDY